MPPPATGAPLPQGPGAPGAGKGLLGSLFDFSFRHFATPYIVRIVYILATVVLALAALGVFVSALTMLGRQPGPSLLLLVLTPIGFLVYLAIIRMTMELYVAVTRAADELGRIREGMTRR